MIRSHKIRLRPTEDQKIHLMRGFAAARHAWNWGKEILDVEYDYNRLLYATTGEKHRFIAINAANKKTGQRSLKMWYNQTKPPWVGDKTASATQEAFADLQRGLKRYFDIQKGKVDPGIIKKCNTCQTRANIKGRGWTCKNCGKYNFVRSDGRSIGWLNWRSKKKHNSFRVTNVYLKFDGPYVRYNAKIGYIRMCEELRFDGKIMNATFSYDGQWFWVSVQVEIERPNIEPSPEVGGLDLGIKYLAVTSDGEEYHNPKAYYKSQAKLRRLQRKLDRQRRANNPDCFNPDGTAVRGKRPDKKSNRMLLTEEKIKRLTTRIRNIRRNSQHHLTADVSQKYGLIFIEDLNVKGMLKNRKLAKSISDAGFYEIRRQLEYKADYQGGLVEVIDQWFPSSKTCSGCGQIKVDLSQNDRVWTCVNCGQRNERDLNAAINLRNKGLSIYNTNGR